jgi:hypothetical protein
MQIGVIIRGFDSRDADQGRRITRHRVLNILNQALGSGGIHHIAHPDFMKHGDHSLLGLVDDLGRALHLSFHGHPRRHWRRGIELFQACIYLRFNLLGIDCGRRGRHIQALAAVNPHFSDAAGANFFQICALG